MKNYQEWKKKFQWLILLCHPSIQIEFSNMENIENLKSVKSIIETKFKICLIINTEDFHDNEFFTDILVIFAICLQVEKST